MRRLLTFLVVAAAVAAGSTWWLYEGDLAQAVAPVVPEWNADQLALRAGVVDPAVGASFASPEAERETEPEPPGEPEATEAP
ncbi:MAG: hypothetical protein H6735_10415 [Alphaproteobacteria bacterium]|nr:hypothetical protein [Alphaproteobacteria bacterium]